MPKESVNNKKIAKNTIYLYFRTLVVLIISLYTSRIVLDILGASDFGIYTVVGGIIALMGFLQSAQSKSTSRFITYELGRNGIGENLKRVFNASLSIHIMAAVIAILLCETVGLWIVCNWVKIPLDRHFAAILVFQFSILVFCIQLIRVPFDSVVIAHEEMSIFAYLSIIEVILQLCLVLILKFVHTDSLVLYAASMVLSSLVLLILYYSYVRYKYPIYKFKFLWDKKLSKSILSFSGWTLFGSGANAITQQGVGLLMNNYVGLVANASIGLSNQVNIAVGKFVNGFTTAFTPQVIKLYAQKNISELNLLISRSSKFSFSICYIMVLPILCNTDYILTLWLGNDIPEYTVGFCRMILICTLFDATTSVFNTAITATGKIKAYQIGISLSFLLDLFLSFILLYIHINPVLVFSSRILTRGIINMIIGLYFINQYLEFNISIFLQNVFIRILVVLFVTSIPILFIYIHTEGILRLLITTFVSIVLTIFAVFFILMTKKEQSVILSKFISILHRK